MNDSERIKARSSRYNLSINKLAKEAKLNSPQVLYDITRGRNGISKEVAEKITALYPEIAIGWLLTGEGRMLKTESEHPVWQSSELEHYKWMINILQKELEQKREEYDKLREETDKIREEILTLLAMYKKKESFAKRQA